jgi:hypothetical protein
LGIPACPALALATKWTIENKDNLEVGVVDVPDEIEDWIARIKKRLLKRVRRILGRALGCLKIVKTTAEGADALFYLRTEK